MIVLGILPGVRSLAYCVLYRAAPPAEDLRVVDSDLLKGGRPRAADNEAAIRQKARPHKLTLDVVIERAFDLDRRVVMAIGPGSDQEPSQLTFLVRAMLTGLAQELTERSMPIRCVNWMNEEALTQALGMSPKKAVRKILGKVSPPMVREPYMLAAATALAGLQQELGQV